MRRTTQHRAQQAPGGDVTRRPRTRRYLLADPAHVDVRYAINPWMDPAAPFDPERAQAQWRQLRDTLVGLGHDVAVLPARPDLPDLVFAANGALVLGDRALVARFAHAERRPEADLHRRWLHDRGITTVDATGSCEGEGDLLVVGRRVLVGHGFRSQPSAAADVATLTDREVVPVELVDPRYYHLDTALGVLDDHTIVWHPPAVAPAAADRLRALYPTAIEVDRHDAELLGCNLVSDGRHVVVPAGVDRLLHDLTRHGFDPVTVDLSELRLAGGGPKCCVAEHHPA